MTDFTTSSVSLSWRGVEAHFKVQFTDGINSWTENTAYMSHTIYNLTSGVMYNVTVTAVAGDGQTEGEGQTVSQHTSKISGFGCKREICVFNVSSDLSAVS